MSISLYRSYSTTVLLTPSYSLGFCTSMFLCIQLLSGFFLSTGYVPTSDFSFESIHSNILRDLDSGWCLRSVHANGASFFMLTVYMHMFRCLWHGSPSRSRIWLVGVIMYILLSGCCFTGYSLVYGQMSLWAIVVICSLVTAVPYVGTDLLHLIWGGSVVSGVTLHRVFCVHFILPFVLAVFSLMHIYFLHGINSSGEYPIVASRRDRINFYPLLLVRDLAIFSLVLVFYSYYVFFSSDELGHPDNYVPANALVTPPEIAPEWYFLPVYAVVRAVPHKALGVICMLLMFLSLANIFPGVGHHGILRSFLPAFGVRWWVSSGSPSSVSPLSRSLLLLVVLDIYLSSKLCLLVNHSESLYWLLLSTVLGFAGSELGRGYSGVSR
jgi:ubiquinol-cytochrome c reductase cytochrome b subunit